MAEGVDAILLADIGGTHARMALWPGRGPVPPPRILRTAAFPEVAAALAHVLEGRRVAAAAVCAAGPLAAGAVRLTNRPWTVTEAGIAAATGATRVLLVNDFAAIAAALPGLGADACEPVGGGPADPGAPRIVVGPGTGLGMAALVPCGAGRWHPVASEGGHADLAPTTEREAALLADLAARWPRVSAEQVLSGLGLPELDLALARRLGRPERRRTAEEIAAAALEGTCPVASETIACFTGWLGAVAGNLALIWAARGGVYLAGGFLARWGRLFDRGLFRSRFEAKGGFAPYLAAIPVFLITAEHVALRGLARLAVPEPA